MNYKLAIFDMDGTILDTIYDLCDCLNYSLERCGYPKRSVTETRAFVGDGINKLIERAVPFGTDDDGCEKVLKIFREYYPLHCADKTVPYDGITGLIGNLRKNGCMTAVVSNKDDSEVCLLVEKYFDTLFDYAVGLRKGVRRKPYPDSVISALEKLNVKRNEAIYIGDSEVDIRTAENSGLRCISVLWGFRDKAMLIENGAELLVQTPAEIEKIICGQADVIHS